MAVDDDVKDSLSVSKKPRDTTSMAVDDVMGISRDTNNASETTGEAAASMSKGH